MTTKHTNEQSAVMPRVLIEQSGKEKPGILAPWYRFSAPKEPPADADLAARELFRRGRLTSTVLLIFLLLALLFIPVAYFSTTKFLFPLMLVVIAVIAVSIACNRFGKITTAGIILVASVEIAFIISLKTQRGGLSVYNLPTLDMLVLPELLAVSLLPAVSIFIVAALNSIFIWLALDTALIVHAPDLQLMMGQSGYNVLIRPIIIQILVAIVAFLWVRSTQRAIARADRAEVIAQLEHAIAQQEHKTAQEKRQLEASIQQIVQAHTQIANGDYNIRIPLIQGNILWQIAGSLNNLLARLQRYRQDSQQHQQMLQAIDFVTVEVRRAKAARQLAPVPRTGTPLDALLLELNTPAQMDANFEQYSPSLRHPPELYR